MISSECFKPGKAKKMAPVQWYLSFLYVSCRIVIAVLAPPIAPNSSRRLFANGDNDPNAAVTPFVFEARPER